MPTRWPAVSFALVVAVLSPGGRAPGTPTCPVPAGVRIRGCRGEARAAPAGPELRRHPALSTTQSPDTTHAPGTSAARALVCHGCGSQHKNCRGCHNHDSGPRDTCPVGRATPRAGMPCSTWSGRRRLGAAAALALAEEPGDQQHDDGADDRTDDARRV